MHRPTPLRQSLLALFGPSQPPVRTTARSTRSIGRMRLRAREDERAPDRRPTAHPALDQQRDTASQTPHTRTVIGMKVHAQRHVRMLAQRPTAQGSGGGFDLLRSAGAPRRMARYWPVERSGSVPSRFWPLVTMSIRSRYARCSSWPGSSIAFDLWRLRSRLPSRLARVGAARSPPPARRRGSRHGLLRVPVQPEKHVVPRPAGAALARPGSLEGWGASGLGAVDPSRACWRGIDHLRISTHWPAISGTRLGRHAIRGPWHRMDVAGSGGGRRPRVIKVPAL